MAAHQHRAESLLALVECRAPLAGRIAAVRELPWGSDGGLVRLELVHVVGVLRRFVRGELSARDVEAWADALEMRDDVGYDAEAADALFRLATPEIHDELTPEVAASLISSYDGRPTTRMS